MSVTRRTTGRLVRDYSKQAATSAEEAFALICGTLGKDPASRNVSARCPAHEDRNPSFGAKLTDERIIMNCAAGCTISEINAALVKLGIPESALYATTIGDYSYETTPSPSPPTEKFVAQCALNARGRLEGLARRWGVPRSILVEAEFGHSGKHWIIPIRDRDGVLVDYRRGYLRSGTLERRQRKGSSLRLYLPRTLKPGPVLVTEGESDTLAALASGANAVGVFGTSVAKDLSALEGRDVVLVFDAGQRSRKGERLWKEALASVAQSVRVYRWDEERPEGYDVRAFLTEGGSVQDLFDAPFEFNLMSELTKAGASPSGAARIARLLGGRP